MSLIIVTDLLTKTLAVTTANGACKEPNFFGLITWYHYLDVDSKCNVKNFNILSSGKSSDVLLVLLAVVDDLLRVAGLLAVGFVIYGAIQFITSEGESDKTAKAQKTIVNALVGLVIAIAAVSVVTFVGGRLGAN